MQIGGHQVEGVCFLITMHYTTKPLPLPPAQPPLYTLMYKIICMIGFEIFILNKFCYKKNFANSIVQSILETIIFKASLEFKLSVRMLFQLLFKIVHNKLAKDIVILYDAFTQTNS